MTLLFATEQEESQLTQMDQRFYPGFQIEKSTYPDHPSQPVQTTHVSHSIQPRLTADPELHSQLVQLPYQFPQPQPRQPTYQVRQPQPRQPTYQFLPHQQVNPTYPIQSNWPRQTAYQVQSQHPMQLTYPAQPSAEPHSSQFLQPGLTTYSGHISQSGPHLNQGEI